MLSSNKQVQELARRYRLNDEDVMLIALNACGARSRLPHHRMRFRLRLHQRPEKEFFFIISLSREDSPFELLNDRILFHGQPFAEVTEIENDDAVLSYFRNGTRVLTLNSNARSQCVGCAFCPTILQDESDPRLRAMDDLRSYLALVAATMNWPNLASLDTVTVCTGCFMFEDRAIDHLADIRKLLQSYSCTANLQFLSSVVRSPDGFRRIRETIAPFHLTLTVECLSNRSIILKASKASLTYAKMHDVLRVAKEYECQVDFTYIVGLDPMDVAIAQLPSLVAEVTTFPRFQVFQSHSRFMDRFVCSEATNIEYFLTIRQYLEGLFIDRGLRPRSWENYRPLWYFTFAHEDLDGTQI